MRFQVIRLDDNGNEFLLAEFATREEAEAYMLEFEHKISGHKQTVFVREL